MADTKISGLTSATPVDADYLAGVDVSDTTQSPGGSTVRFTFSAIWTYISGKLGALATKSTVATADITDGAVTYAKMQPAATGASVLAKTAAGAGAFGELAAATNTVLRRVGGDLGFGLLSKVHLNANIVDNTILSQVATQTIKGRTSSGTGNCEDLTPTQVTAMLDAFTSTLKGLVPASGGGTTNFLRADGTWAAPAGGGSTGTTYFNGTGGTLAKGTPVCLAAFDAGSGNPGMAAADADGAGLMPCIGILGAAVSAGASGIPVITGGEITGLDTSAWALGDVLYVGAAAGTLTNSRPATGYVQPVALVSRVDAVNGEIVVALGALGQLITALTLATTIDGTERFPISGDLALTTGQLIAEARKVDYIAETTTARTLSSTDSGKAIGAQNAGATVFTLPANATVALPVGFTCHFMRDTAAVVTIAGEAGVTVNGVSAGTTTISTSYRGVVTAHKTATDTWFLRGDCAAVA